MKFIFVKKLLKIMRGLGRYDFYRYKNHINFDYFKNKFLKLYKDTLEVPKVSDGEYNLLSYKLNNKNYKAIIFTDILSNEQRDVFYEIINLSRKTSRKIIFHKFETKLLLEKINF